MNRSGNRFELAVGLFLLLSFATLLVLAFASTNGKTGLGGGSYTVTARFSNIGELRVRAPVKIGGVTVGEISRIQLDPQTFEAVLTLKIDSAYSDIPVDTSAAVFTSGLLGERYVALAPGGDPEPLRDGDEIVLTQSAVVLEQLIGKYLFGGGDENAPATDE
ncbi:outer membrane lipid asymmetry maintenance protein MlaD [Rehaibacterium terrae]|jgi:phospholipid/cholesterol/gamma-HCH transport system substrate-binding protein|uniref:Phospholipid/cholesterol/gamma-HCH transport system substrate-binding protein n=1 Tax=Rehaibacterium terrae TaxID=1341696 RepID=A0A7W7XYR0_9GAMM|nr:outer membrane lipid asymmetry maintenance protein MlaD [Rehaibacterium terrae]MBB5014909.1 phospholipid/cholesterol/gamma-HCH transport system substrate-binding protein [Rehaibacterium terrae]